MQPQGGNKLRKFCTLWLKLSGMYVVLCYFLRFLNDRSRIVFHDDLYKYHV